MHVRASVGVQRTSLWGWFSPSTFMSIPGIYPRFSGLHSALYPLSHLIHPANSLPITICCHSPVANIFPRCRVSMHCRHKAWVCVGGVCSGMNRNQQIQGTHLMVTPEGTTKSRGFPRPNAEDCISCFINQLSLATKVSTMGAIR